MRHLLGSARANLAGLVVPPAQQIVYGLTFSHV